MYWVIIVMKIFWFPINIISVARIMSFVSFGCTKKFKGKNGTLMAY